MYGIGVLGMSAYQMLRKNGIDVSKRYKIRIFILMCQSY